VFHEYRTVLISAAVTGKIESAPWQSVRILTGKQASSFCPIVLIVDV
jgi:hypothetical protein